MAVKAKQLFAVPVVLVVCNLMMVVAVVQVLVLRVLLVA
jgi:hypothetical protein